MLSEKLANAMKNEVKTKNMSSFSLNFKIEGEAAERFDSLATNLSKSRTELAKFIILNSLDDLLEQFNKLAVEPLIESEEASLDMAILQLVAKKINKFEVGRNFELKELIGDDDWQSFGDHGNKNRAGRRFKSLVDSGQIKTIKFVCTKQNNHALYIRVA
jgi:hypothetical protein